MASPLKRIQDEELKKAFDLKTKQEEKRVAYDVVLNKHREFTAKSDGKTTPKGDELEQSLNVAKAAYDTLNQQLINRLNDFDQVRFFFFLIYYFLIYYLLFIIFIYFF